MSGRVVAIEGWEHELQADVEGCGWWGVWQDQASGLTKLLCPPS